MKRHTFEQIYRRFRLQLDGSLVRIGSRSKAKLGTTKHDGFKRIIYEGKCYQASHIVFLLKHGHWPKGQIMYRDKDKDNVNAANLIDVPLENVSASARSVPIQDSFGNCYDSISDASRKVGRSAKSITRALEDGRTSAGRHWFRIREQIG